MRGEKTPNTKAAFLSLRRDFPGAQQRDHVSFLVSVCRNAARMSTLRRRVRRALCVVLTFIDCCATLAVNSYHGNAVRLSGNALVHRVRSISVGRSSLSQRALFGRVTALITIRNRSAGNRLGAKASICRGVD